MPNHNQRINLYLSDSLDSCEQDLLREELLLQCPELFLDQCEQELLLHCSHRPLDVKDDVMQQVLQTSPCKAKPLRPVRQSSRRTRRRKAKAQGTPILTKALWACSSMAALLVIIFVLGKPSPKKIEMGRTLASVDGLSVNGQRVESGTILYHGDVVSGAGKLRIHPGIKIESGKLSRFSISSELGSILSLASGRIELQVASRKGKTPLFFHLPQGKVQVVGTSFRLEAGKQVSSVSVSEGRIELQNANGSIAVNAGESGFCKADGKLHKPISLPKQQLHLSFERLYAKSEISGRPRLSEQGFFGKCLDLDGQSGITFKRKREIFKFSISLWFRHNSVIKQRQIILAQHEDKPSNPGYYLGITKGGQVQLKMVQNTTKFQEHQASVLRNQWNHLVFCRNHRGEFTLYFNGHLVKSGNYLIDYDTNKMQLGKCSNPDWKGFEGQLDELRIYDRMLSEEDVKTLFSEKELMIK